MFDLTLLWNNFYSLSQHLSQKNSIKAHDFTENYFHLYLRNCLSIKGGIFIAFNISFLFTYDYNMKQLLLLFLFALVLNVISATNTVLDLSPKIAKFNIVQTLILTLQEDVDIDADVFKYKIYTNEKTFTCQAVENLKQASCTATFQQSGEYTIIYGTTETNVKFTVQGN